MITLDELKKLRADKKLSVEQVARKAGISAQHIRTIENETRPFMSQRAGSLLGWARALGTALYAEEHTEGKPLTPTMVRRARKDKKLSREQLAELTGFSPGKIESIESARTSLAGLSVKDLHKYLDMLGLPPALIDTLDPPGKAPAPETVTVTIVTGEDLKDARGQTGLGLAETAAKIGISTERLAQYEAKDDLGAVRLNMLVPVLREYGLNLAGYAYRDKKAPAMTARKIRQMREDKGLTLEQLASATGISLGVLYKIESGRTKADSMTVRTAMGLARVLGLPPESLDKLVY